MNYLLEITEKAESVGMTVHGLFRAAGVSYTNWWRYKRGETKPNMQTFDKLMAVEPPADADSSTLSD